MASKHLAASVPTLDLKRIAPKPPVEPMVMAQTEPPASARMPRLEPLITDVEVDKLDTARESKAKCQAAEHQRVSKQYAQAITFKKKQIELQRIIKTIDNNKKAFNIMEHTDISDMHESNIFLRDV